MAFPHAAPVVDVGRRLSRRGALAVPIHRIHFGTHLGDENCFAHSRDQIHQGDQGQK